MTVAPPAPARAAVVRERLWTGPLGTVVAGVFATAFLFAFEAYAVAVALPLVAADLDGVALYAVSFAAPLAASVATMTAAGPWADRSGPGGPLLAGVGGFVVGLLVAGLAPTMEAFLAGRIVQGLGSGLVTVALYVLVGQVFDEHLRPRVFVVMTSAWVLPALVGPLVAGWVAETFGWRWALLGAVVPSLVAVSLLVGVARRPGAHPGARLRPGRVLLASAAAVGVLGVSSAARQDSALWPVVLVASLAVVAVVVPPLLPRGTWTGRHGLPAVIATRSVVSLAFFGVEAYLPLVLVEQRSLTPTQAGLFLTGGAVLWFAGSWLAANLPALADAVRRVRLGTGLVALGAVSGVLVVAGAPLAVVAALWPLAGLGMGVASSTLSVLLLERAAPGEHGAASAGMQTSDAVVQAVGLALGGVLVAVLLPVAPVGAYAAVLAVAPVAGLAALAVSGRIGRVPGA
ncbi:MFS transporter [Actinotalea sp. AC32]|nr:MFS transporter [Actinotalea sp. AC32]